MRRLTFAGAFWAATVLSLSGAPNSAVGHDTVTVLRGAAVEVVEPGRKGPTVLRGTGATIDKAAVPLEPTEVNIRDISPRVVGGRNVWLFDPKSRKLIGCRFRFTSSINSQFIRCTKRGL